MGQLKDKLKDVPKKPGVYKFLGKRDEVLYVGKAKNLRSRLSQYFGKSDTRAQLPYLMQEAVDFDYVVVRTELESLFLENTLIKEYNPPYNIMLRDDKSFAFLKIDYSTPIPQLTYSRKVEKNPKDKYFGPYSSTKKISQTLDLVRRIFHFCSNKEVGKRPCFYYHLHRCPGVCVGQISLKEYERHIKTIEEFLSGHSAKIRKQLQRDMVDASKSKKYELAARLRDQNSALETLEHKQLTILSKNVAWDLISVYISGTEACVNLFKVREGKLRDKEDFLFRGINLTLENNESNATQTFLENYYASATDLPSAIFTQVPAQNAELIEKLLASRNRKKIRISVPARGEKLKLIQMGFTNAEEFLLKWQRNQATNLDSIRATLESLQSLLKLPTLPRRIEGYDISNIQGTNPVGSMVVTKDGLPANSEYRKFKITGKNTPDDFLMMREMLTRRLIRLSPTLRKENKDVTFPSSPRRGGDEVDRVVKKNTPPPKSLQESWPTPDLIVIDGGKGQLGVAVEVLQELKLKIPVIGLAKRIEEIFLPHKSKPIILSHDNPVLQLLQRLRDEAHRFGITFHKSLRSKQAVKSKLDEISGIGPKTKKLLKQKLGTVEQIRQTPLDELEKLVGPAKAKIIKASL